MEETKKGTIILYPAPFLDHIVSMVELAKLIILHHSHRFYVTVILTTGIFENDAMASYIDHISQTNPSITFHRFPPLPDIFLLELLDPNLHPSSIIFEFIRLNNPNLHDTLQTISSNSSIPALVIDSFCNRAFDVSECLNIPIYCYNSSGASALAVFLYFPTIHNLIDKSIKDLGNTDLNIPGTPKIVGSQIPKGLLDRDNGVYNDLLEMAINIPRSRGVITNSFEALEARAIEAIKFGNCTPGVVPPAVFYIGPLIEEPINQPGGSDCLSWLDRQPSQSVVFLCFGNCCEFSMKQIAEIAVGLERSGQRFLWVIRNPPENWADWDIEEFDLELLMPIGFLDRTRDRGLVVKSGAPQLEVLNKEAVGGFVTHCGWNSVLEAVSVGMPMVAWPTDEDEHINKELLVEEMKLAMPMEVSNKDGYVVAGEIEKKVKALMTVSEEGFDIRRNCLEMSQKARAAWATGGSSWIAFSDLAESWTIH